MPLIQSLLYHIPIFLFGFLIVAVYVTSTVISLLILRKFYSYKRRKDHNDVAGFIFATLGVIYAVILAFIIIVSWEQFEKADDITSKEANCIASLHQDLISLPAEFRAHIKGELADYVNAIIHDEWQTMQKGQRSPKVDELQAKLIESYSKFEPKNENQKIFFAESIRKLNEANELRRQRLVYASTGIHSILYMVLFIGSFITIAFSMFFGTGNFAEHLIMASCLAAMIAFALFTIIALDYPFTGKYSIEPDVFIKIIPSMINN